MLPVKRYPECKSLEKKKKNQFNLKKKIDTKKVKNYGRPSIEELFYPFFNSQCSMDVDCRIEMCQLILIEYNVLYIKYFCFKKYLSNNKF